MKKKATIKNPVKPFKSEGKIAKNGNRCQVGNNNVDFKQRSESYFQKTDFKDDEIVFTARSLGGSSLYPRC